MEIKRIHWTGIVLGLILVLASLIFRGTNVFVLIMGIGIFVIISPFILSVIIDSKSANEKEEMFLEFTRNLVESVKAGIPISKSIINVKNKPYGALSQHVFKLANQISLGIPLNQALNIFAKDVNNKVVSRTITLIGQAEKSGGDIGEILEDVAGAVNMSDKLKKERKSSISTLVAQGYIIFFVFIVIILIMQFRIVPMVSGIAGTGGEISGTLGSAAAAGGGISPEEISSSFLYLLLVQGFFSGLAIGKLSEGSIKAGLRHSFILVVTSFLISVGATALFGA